MHAESFKTILTLKRNKITPEVIKKDMLMKEVTKSNEYEYHYEYDPKKVFVAKALLLLLLLYSILTLRIFFFEVENDRKASSVLLNQDSL